MGKDTVFLYAIAAVAVCFALVNALLLLVKRGKTAQTIGTISSIKMPNAETAKARNSKWAENIHCGRKDLSFKKSYSSINDIADRGFGYSAL